MLPLSKTFASLLREASGAIAKTQRNLWPLAAPVHRAAPNHSAVLARDSEPFAHGCALLRVVEVFAGHLKRSLLMREWSHALAVAGAVALSNPARQALATQRDQTELENRRKLATEFGLEESDQEGGTWTGYLAL